MQNNDDNLKNEIEKIFEDAWADAPKVGGLDDLGTHIANSIKDVTNDAHGNYQNLITGKITILDEDENNEIGKGCIELRLLTCSISPIHKMLENYTPKLDRDEFIAVMTNNDDGQLTLIAFANGHQLTTLKTNGETEVNVIDYEATKKMLKNNGAQCQIFLKVYDRLIEIAKQ